MAIIREECTNSIVPKIWLLLERNVQIIIKEECTNYYKRGMYRLLLKRNVQIIIKEECTNYY